MVTKTFVNAFIHRPQRPLIPYSSYYRGTPSADSAFGTEPIGQIGLHHPREILRVERDYSGGELIQFAPVFPLELDGRVSPANSASFWFRNTHLTAGDTHAIP